MEAIHKKKLERVERDVMMKAVNIMFVAQKEEVVKTSARPTGKMAERIISMARKNNRNIAEDGELMRLLAKLELRKDVTEDLYEAVAEVMCFMYDNSLKAAETDEFELKG